MRGHGLARGRQVLHWRGRGHCLELRLAERILEIDLLVAVWLRWHLLLKVLLLGPTSHRRRVVPVRGSGTTPAERIVVHLLLQILELFPPDFFLLGALALLLLGNLLLPLVEKLVLGGGLSPLLLCETSVRPSVEWARVLLSIGLLPFLGLGRWRPARIVDSETIISLEDYLVMLLLLWCLGRWLLHRLWLESLRVPVFIESWERLDGLWRRNRILLDWGTSEDSLLARDGPSWLAVLDASELLRRLAEHIRPVIEVRLCCLELVHEGLWELEFLTLHRLLLHIEGNWLDRGCFGERWFLEFWLSLLVLLEFFPNALGLLLLHGLKVDRWYFRGFHLRDGRLDLGYWRW